MKISDTGINLIKHFESLNDGDLSTIGLQPKADCSGYYTIGWGHCLIKKNGKYCTSIEDVTTYFPEYLTIDNTIAESLLRSDLVGFENHINSLNIDFNQNQFDSLISFTFNVGFGNLKNSTLLKLIEGTVDTPSIEESFLMWDKSAGVELKGLKIRRQAEADLYNS